MLSFLWKRILFSEFPQNFLNVYFMTTNCCSSSSPSGLHWKMWNWGSGKFKTSVLLILKGSCGEGITLQLHLCLNLEIERGMCWQNLFSKAALELLTKAYMSRETKEIPFLRLIKLNWVIAVFLSGMFHRRAWKLPETSLQKMWRQLNAGCGIARRHKSILERVNGVWVGGDVE